MTAAMEYPDGATPLDPDELSGLKFKHITTREQLDELEQANIESGLRACGKRRAYRFSAAAFCKLSRPLPARFRAPR